MVCEIRIRRELIAGIHDGTACRPIAHGIIDKGLRIQQQGMAGAGEPIQLIVAEGLRSSAVCEAGSVSHGVVDVVGLVDQLAHGG